MIYRSFESAAQWAAILNARRGHPKARPVLTEYGWTVIASYN